MSSSSIAQENRNSPPFLSPLHGPETETRKTPACNLFALSGFTAFRKGWALLSQEKGGWWARGRAQCRYNVQDKHVRGARYFADTCFSLHHHLFTRYHSEAATVACNPRSILQFAHGVGSPKSPQVQGEAGRTNSHTTTAQIQNPFAVHTFPKCPWQGW